MHTHKIRTRFPFTYYNGMFVVVQLQQTATTQVVLIVLISIGSIKYKIASYYPAGRRVVIYITVLPVCSKASAFLRVLNKIVVLQ